MALIRVGVLRGGPSSEYDVSLETGGHVLEVLRNELAHLYAPYDIYISKEGEWHMHGRPISIESLQNQVDVIWNALHGHFGEDGQVQQILDKAGIPYTGSGALASADSMNKFSAKQIFEQNGILTPEYMLIKKYDGLREVMDEHHYINDVVQKIFHTMAPPWILKPKSGGSSIGVQVAKTLPALRQAVTDSIWHNDDILVEEYIPGIEATAAVIDGFRGQEKYVTMPIDIGLTPGAVYGYDEKYGDHAPRVRGRLTSAEAEKIQTLAREIHDILGLAGYSRSDFMVRNGKVYVLETNSLPGLTKKSFVPYMLKAHGSGMGEFVHHILSQLTKNN